ncbi:MAG: nucleotidyltransferase [Clostridium sp.]|uniref:nucleotidyltransferase n=1 Tax=Clostridium sp. TaxID=1506 RepID=UPI002FC9DE56
MNLTGIITEYNPFHLGHKYHLTNAKKETNCNGVVCVMSGNFMQRGNPAIFDKWTRAKMAVLNGVDLVIELPLIYSLSSAEDFAYGGVKLLNSLNCINNIYFGSESGDISKLKEIASILYYEPEEYKKFLKENLKNGLPFHKSRANSLHSIMNDEETYEILSNSNNILGIEYIKALLKLESNITPFTLKREGNNYNDKNLSNSFSSATSIRETLKNSSNFNETKNSLPIESYNIINSFKKENYNFSFEENLFYLLKYKLLTKGDYLKNIDDVSEGLDNKILKEILSSNSLDELILKSKSKRYTYTRISRILSKFFIGFEDFDVQSLKKEEITYVRPLAFNETGASILKNIKNNSDINIITKLPKHISSEILKLDVLSTKAYSVLNSNTNPLDDYFKSPYVQKRI